MNRTIQKVVNSADPRLKLAYEDKEAKVKFYTFTDGQYLPALRGIAAQRARRFVEMNITERNMKALVKKCKDHAQKMNVVDAFAIIHEIEYRLEFLGEEESLIDLVCLYYMLEDESPDFANETANAKKREFIQTNAKARAFFLPIAVSLSSKLSNKHLEDALGYLQEVKPLAERIYRFIPEMRITGSSNGSTGPHTTHARGG